MFAKVLRDSFIKKSDFLTLSTVNWISYDTKGADIRTLLKHQFKKAPDSIEPFVKVDDVYSMAGSLKEGLGVGYLPMALAEGDLKAGRLVLIGPRKEPFINHLSLIWVDDAGSRAVVAFRKHLIRFCRKQSG